MGKNLKIMILTNKQDNNNENAIDLFFINIFVRS